MSTATVTAPEKQPEPEELQEQARALVQMDQAEQLTMGGHLRNKLRMGRRRLAETWGLKPEETQDDDMQVLARDIIFPTEYVKADPVATPAPLPAPAPAPSPVVVTRPARKLGWLAPVAIALGLGVPATTAILMAPSIISAFHPQAKPPVVVQPGGPDYAPILLPGKPQTP